MQAADVTLDHRDVPASTDLNAAGLRADERMERLKLFGLSSPAILMVLVILVIPVGWLFYVSFVGADGQFSLENYERMINRKSYSIKMVHNMTGTLIGMVHIMLPFLILPLYSTMKSINRDYMKAASNLGASPRRAFWNVFFPLSTPGLFAGSLMVFILCLGFFVTPAVLGGGKVIMVSMKIVSNIELFVNWGAASALGVVLLLMTMAILWIASRFLNLEKMTGGGH